MAVRSPPASTGGSTVVATSQFLAADGDPTAPGYAFSAQPSTGIYRTAAPDLRFSLAGNYIYLFSATQFLPTAVGTNDLGSTAFSWRRLYLDFTNTATVGAVTINKALGRVNIAAAGTSVVVTNNTVTAASKVFCTIAQNDATAILKNVVPAAGSFTINLNAAATAQVAIDFLVVNAD